jgi:hypothetical protein
MSAWSRAHDPRLEAPPLSIFRCDDRHSQRDRGRVAGAYGVETRLTQTFECLRTSDFIHELAVDRD